MTPQEKIAAELAAQQAAATAAAEAETKRLADEAAAAAAKVIADEAAAAALAAAGKDKPTDAEAKLLKEVMEKKAALQAANEAKVALEAKLKAFDGLDATEIRALAEAKRVADEASLVAKGDWERLKTQMADTHGKEKATLVTQLEAANTAKSALVSQIAELTVGNAFGTSKFVTEALTLTPNKARVIYGGHFEFKDGVVTGFDKPAGASDRTPLVDASGNALAFDDAMTKIVEADSDRDQLLKSRSKSGSGGSAAAAAAAAAAATAAAAAAALAAGSSAAKGSGLSKIAAGLAKGIGK